MVTSSRLRTIPPDTAQSTDLAEQSFLFKKFKASLQPTWSRDNSKKVFIIDKNKLGIAYVDKIIKKLMQIDGIESITTVLPIPNNYHTVVFQIKLFKSFNSEEEDENFLQEVQPEKIERILENARSLVFHECRILRNITNEKWYFRTELISDFND